MLSGTIDLPKSTLALLVLQEVSSMCLARTGPPRSKATGLWEESCYSKRKQGVNADSFHIYHDSMIIKRLDRCRCREMVVHPFCIYCNIIITDRNIPSACKIVKENSLSLHFRRDTVVYHRNKVMPSRQKHE